MGEKPSSYNVDGKENLGNLFLAVIQLMMGQTDILKLTKIKT
jgi:hypothetical protein